MARVIKATDAEKMAYDGVYPLYGFVKVSGHLCVVEFPNEGYDNPKYEVMAPEGFKFGGETHSVLCFSMDDLQTRISVGLEPCGPTCDCKVVA